LTPSPDRVVTWITSAVLPQGAPTRKSTAPAKVAEFFAAGGPQTSAGKIAAARAAKAIGRDDEAARIVRGLWRDGNFDALTEGVILRDFGPSLQKDDHKYRAADHYDEKRDDVDFVGGSRDRVEDAAGRNLRVRIAHPPIVREGGDGAAACPCNDSGNRQPAALLKCVQDRRSPRATACADAAAQSRILVTWHDYHKSFLMTKQFVTGEEPPRKA